MISGELRTGWMGRGCAGVICCCGLVLFSPLVIRCGLLDATGIDGGWPKRNHKFKF